MDASRHQGRRVGLAYLLVVVTGLFSLGYVPSVLSGGGNADTLLANIATHAPLFRAGVAAFLVEQVAFLLLPFLFFGLLAASGANVAKAMVLLAVVSVPMALLASVHRLDALAWVTDPRLMALWPADTRKAMALGALRSWDHAMLLANLFWGLWLAPLGYLILRSRAIPRILGIVLIVGCAGYVVDVFGQVLVGHYADTAISDYATLPAAIGEIGTCLWLLVMGAKPTLHESDAPKTTAGNV